MFLVTPLVGIFDLLSRRRKETISIINSLSQELRSYSTMRTLEYLKVLITFLTPTVYSHTWVEQLMVIDSNGTFVGAPGYARGNVLRTAPEFSDPTMTYLIPPNGRANGSQILPTDRLCKETQRIHNQTEGSPRLQANPGAAIALRFQENGHVTLPWNQPGKPKNRGTVYVYGTTQPRDNETLLAVHKVWNQDGTGGDKRGVLLSVQNFDDGRCYQINHGNISESRQTEFQHEPDKLMGADLWCQQDIALPLDIQTGKPYTLYWVWDWPTAPHVDPGLPYGKPEIYTTCIDVDVVERPTTYAHVSGYINNQSLNNAAIPSQFAQLFRPGSNFSAPAANLSAPSTTPSAVPTTTANSFQPIQATTFVTLTKTIFSGPSVCTFGPSSKDVYDMPHSSSVSSQGSPPVSRRDHQPFRLPPKPGVKRRYQL